MGARGLTQRNTERLEEEAKKTGGEELSWVSTKGHSLQRLEIVRTGQEVGLLQASCSRQKGKLEHRNESTN